MMQANAVEIVKWKSVPGVSDQAMRDAAHALLPDLRAVGGFVDKVLCRHGDEWVDVYFWCTEQDAHLSNERMAGSQSLAKLMTLVRADTVSIVVMPKVE